MSKAEDLLKKARKVLDSYMFSYGDDNDEYNNDEVIDICEDIDDYFKDTSYIYKED